MIKQKILKNNHDYEIALEYIEALMEEPESKYTNDEIETLTSLITINED
jgi:antitoxin component HigA of HigAB toxin-antitoxin module